MRRRSLRCPSAPAQELACDANASWRAENIASVAPDILTPDGVGRRSMTLRDQAAIPQGPRAGASGGSGRLPSTAAAQPAPRDNRRRANRSPSRWAPGRHPGLQRRIGAISRRDVAQRILMSWPPIPGTTSMLLHAVPRRPSRHLPTPARWRAVSADLRFLISRSPFPAPAPISAAEIYLRARAEQSRRLTATGVDARASPNCSTRTASRRGAARAGSDGSNIEAAIDHQAHPRP